MSADQEGQFTPHFEKKSPVIEVMHLPEVRVSSASFIIIQDESGRYALLINKNRAKKGDLLLAPIGGAIEGTAEGLQELQSILGIDSTAFEKGNDLRFKMPGAKANEYREWFLSGKGRENDPSREVVEELVDESNLLTNEELQTLECNPAGYNVELEETTRTGQEGQVTLRLLEIFRAELAPEIIGKLKDLASKPDSLIRFVSSEEIAAGRSVKDVKIAAVSKNLLDPKETIGVFV